MGTVKILDKILNILKVDLEFTESWKELEEDACCDKHSILVYQRKIKEKNKNVEKIQRMAH